MGPLVYSMIWSDRDFQFRDTVIRSKGVFTCFINARYIHDVLILLYAVNVNIPALSGLDTVNGNMFLVDNFIGHLCNRSVKDEHPLKYTNKWNTKLVIYG